MQSDPGLAPLSTPPSFDDLEGEERIDAMVEWFFENFEDPAEETPYNGREGGYIYIHGGPYEAQDYIGDAFPEATEEEHTEAIDRIDADGPNFAPAGHRVLAPEDEYDDQFLPPPLTVRLDALGGQLEEIKTHVAEMLALQRQQREQEQPEGLPPAGHNNPPPDDQPDLYEVLDSVKEVEEELAQPNRITEANIEVLQRAEGRFARFLKWIGKLAKEAPTLIAKGAIGGMGTWGMTYALNHQAQLMELLGTATHTVSIWAGATSGIF